MTLDEAIAHAEEVAVLNEEMVEDALNTDTEHAKEVYAGCKACAEEHWQLAKWLKELKQYQEELVLAYKELKDIQPITRQASKNYKEGFFDASAQAVGILVKHGLNLQESDISE